MYVTPRNYGNHCAQNPRLLLYCKTHHDIRDQTKKQYNYNSYYVHIAITEQLFMHSFLLRQLLAEVYIQFVDRLAGLLRRQRL